MPELPEVEVLRRSLEPRLVGRRIEGLDVHARSLREPISRRAFERAALGRRIERVRRRGKFLLVDLEGESTLVFHLGMSGRLTLAEASRPREPHEHLSLSLDGGERLRLRDPRRFGLALARPTRGLERDAHFARLGREPLDPPVDGVTLRALAAGRRVPVKNFVMDGRAVAGVGNIYATEALFRAGIRPTRSVTALTRASWDALAAAIVAVLREAIGSGGTTLNDFTDGAGARGEFQGALAVYGRAGETCGRCGGRVRRVVLGGRGTFYCPGCQR